MMCKTDGCREDAGGGTHCPSCWAQNNPYEPKPWFCDACDEEVDGHFTKQRVPHKAPGLWLCAHCAAFYRGY